MPRRRTAVVLWLLLGLFDLRVVGQALVGLGVAPFLPPWDEWYSGVLPYPWLLTSQLLILILLGKICLDVTRNRGFFAAARPDLGRTLVVIGWIYAVGMAVRYAIFRSHEIPVFFHLVLAAFLIVYGSYARRDARADGVPLTTP